jgi:tetratricopeptide (TPR) repeat protein
MHSNRKQKLKLIVAENPNDTFALFALAKIYEAEMDFENAIQVFENLLVVDKFYIGAYYHLAKNFEKINEIKKALNIYEQGIKIAEKLHNSHALSELKNAKFNLELDL